MIDSLRKRSGRPSRKVCAAAESAGLDHSATAVRSFRRALVCCAAATAVALASAMPLGAQDFSIEEILSPAFPYDLVSARSAERIAWIEYERGVRNVYTAEAPDFEPVRLTDFTEDDAIDLTGLQISDDGSVVVFIRGHTPNREGWIANPSSDADGAERAAWAVRTSGGKAWRIAEAWNPVLSPDGEWIAYTRGGQIHRAPVDPEALEDFDPDTARPLVTAFGRNAGPVWSPDSKRIAFTSHRGDHAFIAVYDTESHTVRYMSPSVDHDGSPAWSPDGSRVAFVRRPGTPFGPPPNQPWWRRSPEPDTALPDGIRKAGFLGGHTLELWIADATTGQGRRVWHTWPGEERFTDIRGLHWVDGHLLFRSEPGEWEGHLYAVSVENPAREPVELTPGAGFVEDIAFSADGRTLYYTANIGDIDRRHLWRTRIAGGTPEQLTVGDDIDTHPAVLASGERVAVLRAGARDPLAVALLDLDGGATRMVTQPSDDFPRDGHVVPQNVVITAEDGVRFHAQLFLPPNMKAGEKRPAMLFLHGGPRRQMLLGYHYKHFYHMSYAMNQYFANKGYVTLSINFRSGIGYGTAFRDVPDRNRRGNSEYRDVLAAGKYLQSHPSVDAERIGLWGLSYGGILTAQGLARNSDIFKAGVDMAGVHDYGDVNDPESIVFQSSPIAAIDSWTSPVLLIHGDDDRNVSFSQTVGLVQLLRARGIPHELIVYPDDVHEFMFFSRWIEAFEATDDFFDRWLLGGRGIADK